MKLHKIVALLASLLAIPSLVYYTSRFYFYQKLEFTSENLLGWSIVTGLILSNILYSIITNNKLDKMIEKNTELENLIVKYHSENISYQQGSRELLLEVEEVVLEEVNEQRMDKQK